MCLWPAGAPSRIVLPAFAPSARLTPLGACRPRTFGYHEIFHAATIFASILHFSAVCPHPAFLGAVSSFLNDLHSCMPSQHRAAHQPVLWETEDRRPFLDPSRLKGGLKPAVSLKVALLCRCRCTGWCTIPERRHESAAALAW